MRPLILKVSAAEKYKLFVQFSDGVEGVLNLEKHAGRGVFAAWDIDDNFSKVFIGAESGAITWPGEIDIDTYNAYCIIKGISPEDFFKNQVAHATNL